jgi:hypothetical protein
VPHCPGRKPPFSAIKFLPGAPIQKHHTKAPYKSDLLWETRRPLRRPERARTILDLARLPLRAGQPTVVNLQGFRAQRPNLHATAASGWVVSVSFSNERALKFQNRFSHLEIRMSNF